MEILDSLLQRPIIVATAVIGALLASAGSYLRSRPPIARVLTARRLTLLGYGLCGLSIVLFILAGFRSAYV